jgi:hypothetical protein
VFRYQISITHDFGARLSFDLVIGALVVYYSSARKPKCFIFIRVKSASFIWYENAVENHTFFTLDLSNDLAVVSMPYHLLQNHLETSHVRIFSYDYELFVNLAVLSRRCYVNQVLDLTRVNWDVRLHAWVYKTLTDYNR